MKRILILTVKHCSEEVLDDDLHPELPWQKVQDG